jgi:hypothetical protein
MDGEAEAIGGHAVAEFMKQKATEEEDGGGGGSKQVERVGPLLMLHGEVSGQGERDEEEDNQPGVINADGDTENSADINGAAAEGAAEIARSSGVFLCGRGRTHPILPGLQPHVRHTRVDVADQSIMRQGQS